MGLAGALCLGGARRAEGEPPGDDGAPAGAVTFFAGGVCPQGWKVAANVQGRLVVGVDLAANIGIQVGAPLGDREDRAHQHAYSSEVALADKAIAAADGGNTSGAQAQTYTVSGTTEAEPSGLPLIQVQACVKQ